MPAARFSAVDRVLQGLGPLPQRQAQPALVVISGLPGTGKSHFADELRRRTGAVVLESDAVRRLLYERPSYTWQESQRLFTVIHATIERLLREGIPVIFDATNLMERYRRPLYQIADQCGAKLVLVEVTAPSEVALARLAERATAGGSSSDADVAVYERMLPAWEKIRREHVTVDTSKSTKAAVEAVAREMEDRPSPNEKDPVAGPSA